MIPYIKILRNFLLLFGKVRFGEWLSFLYFGENQPKRAEQVKLTVKPLANKHAWIRKYSRTDRDVFKVVFHNQYHLPHVSIPPDSVILDLGSNIGLTVAHYKYLYPQSKILGFEMDAENFALATKNCAGLKDCQIFHNAVWYRNEMVSYETEVDPDAFCIGSVSSPPSDSRNVVTVEAISISEIIRRNHLDGIDFMKMDIEGAEKEVLTSDDLSWLAHVKVLNAEIHDRSFIDQSIKILNDHGFHCIRDLRHPAMISAQKRV